jgi:hypothetical protein
MKTSLPPVSECRRCVAGPLLYSNGGDLPPGAIQYGARGLCHRCCTYLRKMDPDTLHDYPRFTRPQAATYEDWMELKVQGYTKVTAAVRLGMRYQSFVSAIRRHEKKLESING